MVQTTVTPLKANLDISLSFPEDYVGKKVHVLCYIDEEVKDATAKVTPKKKPSDFAGTLSKETAEILLKHVEQSRKEWD